MNNKKVLTSILSTILMLSLLSLVGCGTEKSTISEDATKPVESVNEQNKTEEDNIEKTQMETNTKETQTDIRTEIQGVSVAYPSSWIKKNIKGDDFYVLDNEGTNVNLVVESMRGYSEEDYNKASDIDVRTNLGIDDIKVQEHEFNSKKARITYYIQKKQNVNMPTYQVTFLNNNKSYIFTIIGFKEVSDENMKSFDSMLNTVEFLE